MSIDFVLNTLIENIGQNQLPKLIFFHEILHTTVKANMNSYGKKKLHLCPKNWFYKLISKCILILRSRDLSKIKTESKLCVFTAGNVVRGNQKLCMLNPYESFRP